MLTPRPPLPPPVWPHVKVEVANILQKLPKKSSQILFYKRVMSFKIAQNVTKYFVYFWKKICLKEIFKKSPNVVTLTTFQYIYIV